MEVVVTAGAKLQSNHQQQTNIKSFFLQPGCLSCHPTNSVKALKGKYRIPWTCLPHAHLGVFQLCLWPLIAPGYLGGGLPCLSSALWCQYPFWCQYPAANKWIWTNERINIPWVLRHVQMSRHRTRWDGPAPTCLVCWRTVTETHSPTRALSHSTRVNPVIKNSSSRWSGYVECKGDSKWVTGSEWLTEWVSRV